MGDELRKRMGIAAEWTEEEIKKYKKQRNKLLGPVYTMEGIPLNKPWERVRYWDKKLNINGNIEKMVLQIMEDIDKGAALRFLEQTACNIFY